MSNNEIFNYVLETPTNINPAILKQLLSENFSGSNDNIDNNSEILKKIIERPKTDLVIPEGIKSIGSHAFYNGELFTSITIPDGVKSIGSQAFYNCGFTSITIPSTVTSIADYAFNSCKKLLNITILGAPNIGNYVFNACSNVSSITINSTIPPTLTMSSLADIPLEAPIYVPAESVDIYKTTTNWSARRDYIQAIPEEEEGVER